MDETYSEEDFLRALGAELLSWRKKRHMSREALAEAVGISPTTLGRIERADATAAMAVGDVWRIASYLGVAFTDVVRRAEDAAVLAASAAAPTAPVLGEGRFRRLGVTADVPEHVAAQITKRSISEEQEHWD